MADEEKDLAKVEEASIEVSPVLDLEKSKEKVEVAEVGKEKEKPVGEVKDDEKQITSESEEVAVNMAHATEPTQVPVIKDPLLVDIESILASDLTEVFVNLPDSSKLEFKQKGEEIAGKISKMIASGKVKVSKILYWIQDWLRVIPGVNKYFIEQEAKIKADNIMKYAKDKK